MPGLRIANADDERAKSLLKKMQVNEFFRYVARRPMERAMELCAEKLAQVLGALRMSEAIAAARARRAEDITDRLRAELDMLRRKAADQGDRLFAEEEAKRAALIKYLHSVVGQKDSSQSKKRLQPSQESKEKELERKRRIDGGTGFLGGVSSVASSYEDDFEPDESGLIEDNEEDEELVTVRLGSSGIGDEEVHALVAVLSSKDRCDLLDLRGNSIGDVGARGLASILRDSHALAEVDLRNNFISSTGLKILAEALEHNARVRHVFVHGNGRIEALGTVGGGAGNGDDSSWENESNGDSIEDVVIDTVITVHVGDQKDPKERKRTQTAGASGAELKLEPLPQRSQLSPAKHNSHNESSMSEGQTNDRPKYYTHRQEAERLDDIDAKRAVEEGKRAMDTPLLRKIRDLEGNLGPSAEHPPESDASAEFNAVLEAEKWAARAKKQEDGKGLSEVPDDWIGTETAPQAYASPLTRRIRALEERLAIADMDESGASVPKPASDIVDDITLRKSGGIRSRHAAEAKDDEGKRGGRAKSAVGSSRRRKFEQGAAPGKATPVQGRPISALPSPLPSPAWQGASGPSLLANALRTKEESLNQAVTRDANRQRASSQRRAKSAAGRSRSSKRASAARNLRKHQELREKNLKVMSDKNRENTKARIKQERRERNRKK